MTLYSKWFDTHNEYEAYKNGQNYILPNVSICFNDLDVHYDPYKDPRVIAIFNVTDINQPTKIAGKAPWESNLWFSSIEIDGTEQEYELSEFDVNYQFDTIGRHTIKYTLSDNTKIGEWSFYQCLSLIEVIIPYGVTAIIGDCINNLSNLTSVAIPNSVITLNGFSNCTGLTSITIPDSVTTLSGFSNCTGLTTITIPNSVTTLSGFRDCTGLTSVTISNSVTTIGTSSLRGCTGLTSITLPSSVTTISDGVLSGCTNLTAITILAETPPNIQSSAFGGTTSNCPIYVPANCVDLYKSTLPDFANRIQAIP